QLLQIAHRREPLAPRMRWRIPTRLGKQILAIKQQARVGIPRDAIDMRIDFICPPKTGKIVLSLDGLGSLDVGIKWFEGSQRGKLGNPSVAQLAHVRRRITGERRKQLLVSG